MIFTRGLETITLASPAQYPAGYDYSIVQAKDKSASGVTHVESFVVRTNLANYSFVDMSEADYLALLTWFLDIADGMINDFQLTDDLGRTATVRFTEPRLHFEATSYGLWAGSFQVEEIV
jgi:hypothetical protein